MFFKRYLVKMLVAAALLCGGTELMMGQAATEELWKDAATSLTWTVKDSGTNMNSTQARDYCSALRLGGFSDWRLPTLDELSGLYDARSSKQFKAKGPIELGDSCTLTGSTNNSGEVWSFCFSYGGQSLRAPSGHGSAARVLCVRK
jgi:hypothetical protein